MTIETNVDYNYRKFEPGSLNASIDAISSAYESIRTLIIVPPHKMRHKEIANIMENYGQKLNPSIDITCHHIKNLLALCEDSSCKPNLGFDELLVLSGCLINFSDYVPQMESYIKTPFSEIESMYDRVISKSNELRRPLDIHEQFEIALFETNGNITNSLWRLFLTSRQHARWLDCNAIDELPDFSEEEIFERMINWRTSISAFKETDPQDVAGDNYYFWTHVLAGVAFRSFVENPNVAHSASAYIFEKGTWLMQNIIHRINYQGIINSHQTAAEYGNAVSKTISANI